MIGSPGAVGVSPAQRLEVLFEELAQLQGQRNAIDGRIVEIVAQVEREELWGATGARSLEALVAWKTGCAPGSAKTVTAVARRWESFPRLRAGVDAGPAVVGSGRGDRGAGRRGV